MHRKDVEALLLAVAIAPVAQKHHLTAPELQGHLVDLRPKVDRHLLERASLLAVVPPVA